MSQDQGQPVFVEGTARASAEDETQSVDSEDSSVPGRRASLSDLTDLEDIESLTVRQLKEILARNFVNYKGCCEKWELMERVTRLYKDQKGLQHLGKGAAAPRMPVPGWVVVVRLLTWLPTWLLRLGSASQPPPPALCSVARHTRRSFLSASSRSLS